MRSMMDLELVAKLSHSHPHQVSRLIELARRVLDQEVTTMKQLIV